jgi:hypothetical protein
MSVLDGDQAPTLGSIQPWAVKSLRANIPPNVLNDSYARMHICAHAVGMGTE